MEGVAAAQSSRSLPRWLRLALITLGVIVILGQLAFLLGYAFWHVRFHLPPFDFPVYVYASRRLFDGSMYDWSTPGYIYDYSPVFAYLFVPFALLGWWVWSGLHFLSLLLIPSWPLRILFLLSAAFWMDAWEGNVGFLFAVAGYWAVRNNRWGTLAFFALCLMIPKPVYLPVLAWLLWRQPTVRAAFVALLMVHSALVLATGYALDWIPALFGGSHDMTSPFNFLPSRIIGWWWWPIGLLVAAWLVYRNHPGWATVPAALYGGLHVMGAPGFEPPEQLRRLWRSLFPPKLEAPAARRPSHEEPVPTFAGSRSDTP